MISLNYILLTTMDKMSEGIPSLAEMFDTSTPWAKARVLAIAVAMIGALLCILKDISKPKTKSTNTQSGNRQKSNRNNRNNQSNQPQQDEQDIFDGVQDSQLQSEDDGNGANENNAQQDSGRSNQDNQPNEEIDQEDDSL